MQKKVFTLFICAIILFSAKAQQINQEENSSQLFKHWAVGLNVGLYGGGLQVATTLSPHFMLRAGFDYLSFTYKDDIDFDAPVVNIANYDIDMTGRLIDPNLKFSNAKLLVDYYPVKNGIFCLTAGLYFGDNKITTKGQIDDYKQLVQELGEAPQFEFEDIIIKPNEDGSFNAKLKLGDTVKPYFGLGLGRSIPKSRVGFKFELGVVYQGDWTVESENISEGTYTTNDMAADFDLPVSKDILKLWPMMNFTLSYRFK